VDERVGIVNTLLDDNVDIVDVESSGRNVGRHQDHFTIGLAVLTEDVKTSVLLQVALQAAKVRVLMPLEVSHLDLGLSEDQNFQIAIRRDKLLDEALLGCVVLAQDQLVADGVGHLLGILAHEVEQDRATHVVAGDVLDEGRHSRAENHSLRLWHEPLDAHDVLLEAHVEHFVTFVKDLVLRRLDIQAIVLKQVDETARRRHDDVRFFTTNFVHVVSGFLISTAICENRA